MPDLSHVFQRLSLTAGVLETACGEVRQIASEIQRVIGSSPASVGDLLASLDAFAAQDNKEPHESPTRLAVDLNPHSDIDQVDPCVHPSDDDGTANPAPTDGSEEPLIERNYPPES